MHVRSRGKKQGASTLEKKLASSQRPWGRRCSTCVLGLVVGLVVGINICRGRVHAEAAEPTLHSSLRTESMLLPRHDNISQPQTQLSTVLEKVKTLRALFEGACSFVDAGFDNWVVPMDCERASVNSPSVWWWFRDLHFRVVGGTEWEADLDRATVASRDAPTKLRTYLSKIGAKADADVPQILLGNAHFYAGYQSTCTPLLFLSSLLFSLPPPSLFE